MAGVPTPNGNVPPGMTKDISLASMADHIERDPSLGSLEHPPPLQTTATVGSLQSLDLAAGRSRLSSYVSEPPSTLMVLRTMAQQHLEQERQDQKRNANGAATPASPFLDHQADNNSVGNSNPSANGLTRRRSNNPRDSAFQQTASLSFNPNSPSTARPDHLRENIVWFQQQDGSKDGIIEHSVAGDLAMGSVGAMARKVRYAGPGSRDASPIKYPQAKPSPIKTIGGGSVAGGGAKNVPPGNVPGRRSIDRRDSDDSPTYKWGLNDPDLDDIEPEDDPNKPFYKKKRFWKIFLPLVVFIAFTMAGTILVIYYYSTQISTFQTWRLMYFIAGIPVICWIGDLTVYATVWFVEKSLFKVRNALYYMYAARRPLKHVIRSALAMGWWALIITVESDYLDNGLQTAYETILRIMGCILLFTFGNLLKTLIAKMLASKFNRESHLKKMSIALEKEYLLHALLQPRSDGILDDADYDELDELGPDGKPLHPHKEGGFMHPFDYHLGRRSSSGSKTMRFASKIFGVGIGRRTQSMQNMDAPTWDDDMKKRNNSGGLDPISEETAELEEALSNVAKTSPRSRFADKKSQSLRTGTRSPPTGTATPGLVSPQPSVEKLEIRIDGGPPGSPKNRQSGGRTPLGAGGAFTTMPPLRTGRGSASPTPVGSPAAGGLSKSKTTSPAKDGNLKKQASLANSSARTLKKDGVARSVGSNTSKMSNSKQQQDRLAGVNARRLSMSDPEKGSVVNKMVKLERYIRRNALKVTFRDELNRTERSEVVTTEAEAKKLAFYLFWNVKRDFDKPIITREEIEDFVKGDDVNAAYEMLDDNHDGTITIEDVKNAVLNIFVQRTNLAASLHDTRSIVNSLESIIGFLIHTIFFFFYLFIFQLDVASLYTSLSALILGFSWMFSNSVRQLYENVVFLFVVHPYDVGDMLEIEGSFYMANEITLNFTCFSGTSGQKVWYPNQLLASKPFINVTNSTDRSEAIKILVDFDTSPTVLDKLLDALEELRIENIQEFTSMSCAFRESNNPMKMTLAIYYTFSHNGVDLGRCSRNRTKVYITVAKVLKEMQVQYTWPSLKTPQPGGGEVRTVVAGAMQDSNVRTTGGLGI